MQWGHTVIEKKKRKYLLSSEECSEVENIVRVLQWPYMLTKQLQAEQLTLSDVFGHWTTMEIKLRKESHPLADVLLKHLAKRRVSIIENPAMNAAIYLDPRFNGLLNVEKRNEAAEFLQKLWIRLRNLNGHGQKNHIDEHFDVYCSESKLDFIDMSIDADLLAFVQNTDVRFSKTGALLSADEDIIKTQLIDFYQTKTIETYPKGESILAYWSTAVRFEYPALYELSQILLSVPATQVSVERSFSALRFVLNDYRTTTIVMY